MSDTLPADVRAFLRDHIESYEQLELLLLLQRQPAEAWPLRALAGRTGYSLDLLEEALSGLSRSGSIEKGAAPEAAVRYAPRDAAQKATIDALASAYAQNPLDVIRLMSSNAIDRVRTAAIHTFAEAFVIGRRKDG